jgi:hypothetical protein
MATPQTPESTPEVQEPKNPPVPQVSEPSGGEPTSGGTGVAADALVEEIRNLKEQVAAIPELVQREVQSTKDVRFKPVEAAFTGISPQTLKVFNAYLKKFNGDEDRAIKEMELDAVIAERRQSGQQVPGRTGGPVGERQSSLDDEIAVRLGRARMAGISIPDEELKELWGDKPWPSNKAVLDALDEHIEKKKRQSSVTPAAAVGTTGRPPGASSDNALQQEYKEKLSKIKRGDVQGIVNLKLEYRKKGLNV